MKSYTFANADKPVVAHMRGLQGFLAHIIINEQLVERGAKTKRDKDYSRAKIRAWQEVIDLIEHSHSVDD